MTKLEKNNTITLIALFILLSAQFILHDYGFITKIGAMINISIVVVFGTTIAINNISNNNDI